MLGNGVAGFSFRVSRCSEASSKNLKLETRNFFRIRQLSVGIVRRGKLRPLSSCRKRNPVASV